MSEPTLLGVSYPAPPDCMPRLQHLRHMLDSGIDLGNDVVRELLDEMERPKPHPGCLWEDGCRINQSTYIGELSQRVSIAEAARDALADEVAELRASQLHLQQQRDDLRAIFDHQVAAAGDDAFLAMKERAEAAEKALETVVSRLADPNSDKNVAAWREQFQRGFDRGSAVEREECAQIVGTRRDAFRTVEARLMVDSIAAAIRARGDTWAPSGSAKLAR
jgi:hypothetical protein